MEKFESENLTQSGLKDKLEGLKYLNLNDGTSAAAAEEAVIAGFPC